MSCGFTVQRGETLSLALDDLDGIAGTVTGIVSTLRAWQFNGPVGDDLATLAVTTRAAADGNPGGWTVTLSATQCAALEPGVYAVDARLTIGSGVIKKGPIVFTLVEAVTRP